MKKISIAIIGAAAIGLSACGGSGDDALGENVESTYDAAADNLDAMADNTADPAASAALEAKADGKRAEGDSISDAIDRADVNASTVSSDAVNTVKADANN